MIERIRRLVSRRVPTLVLGRRMAVLFGLLLAAITAVPYLGHRATVRAALLREEARHALLVEQVASRVQEQVEHLAGTIERLSDSVMALPISDPHLAAEVGATWEALATQPGLDGLALCSGSGRPEVRLGPAPAPDSDVSFRSGALAAMLARAVVMDEATPEATGQLRLTLAAPILRPDGTLGGAVVALIDARRTIDRIFEGTYGRSDVSFTVMNTSGRLLLHSGSVAMESLAGIATERCGVCHAPPDPGPEGGWTDPVAADRVSFGGDERVVAYAPVELGGIEWTISASTSVAEVTRPFGRQARIFLAFTASVVVLLSLLGLLLRASQIRAIRLENDLSAERRLLAVNEEKARLASELEASRRLSAIGEMVARVAHEVKNPLHYIGTAADLLSSRVTDPGAVGLVTDMRTGIRALDAIVRELLEFSRPMVLERIPVQVNELARRAATGAAPGKGEVVLALGHGVPTITADGYRINQVLENLVRNAQDALSPRPGRPGVVEIGTSAVASGPLAGGARFWVRDDGLGIPPENLDRIWEPFFTTKTRGSGLGLSVVRRIVEAHGGEASVRSEPGGGTTFEVTLPRGA